MPKYSELRCEEIQRISTELNGLLEEGVSQVWCGDFNTLSRGDYSDQEWDHIVRIRRDNGRRAPLNDVIDTIHNLGFTVIQLLTEDLKNRNEQINDIFKLVGAGRDCFSQICNNFSAYLTFPVPGNKSCLFWKIYSRFWVQKVIDNSKILSYLFE